MSREIKFRAWDYSKKIFLPTKTYAVLSVTEFGATGIMLMDFENYIEGEYFYPHSQVVNQYTGLKDKNEVEIYEGDVVNYHQFLFDGEEHEETGKGIIKSGEYGWLLSNIIHDGISEYMGYSKQDQLDGKVETYLINVYGLHEESFEVIGNIYENPELLK